MLYHRGAAGILYLSWGGGVWVRLGSVLQAASNVCFLKVSLWGILLLCVWGPHKWG